MWLIKRFDAGVHDHADFRKDHAPSDRGGVPVIA